MRLSLRQKLNDLIRSRGSVSYAEIKELCETGRLGRYYKASNAERRLRASESPNVQAIEEHGHIVRYVWKGSPMMYRQMVVKADDGSTYKTLKVPI